MPQRLARNLSSEMSIECSTTANHEQDYDLMLDEIESSEELSLIEQKVKTVFELPDSETLVNGQTARSLGLFVINRFNRISLLFDSVGYTAWMDVYH
jgi:hypothetical protein